MGNYFPNRNRSGTVILFQSGFLVITRSTKTSKSTLWNTVVLEVTSNTDNLSGWDQLTIGGSSARLKLMRPSVLCDAEKSTPRVAALLTEPTLVSPIYSCQNDMCMCTPLYVLFFICLINGNSADLDSAYYNAILLWFMLNTMARLCWVLI